MARTMKTVVAPKKSDNVLVIYLDPLKVARGHRSIPRGKTHGSDRHQSRARAKQQWRREGRDGPPDAS